MMFSCFLELMLRTQPVQERNLRLLLSSVQSTRLVGEKPKMDFFIFFIWSIGTQYASRVSEQYPPRGKISLEIIKDLYQMATDLLKLFAQKNHCFPNKIVFYRDGNSIEKEKNYSKLKTNRFRLFQVLTMDIFRKFWTMKFELYKMLAKVWFWLRSISDFNQSFKQCFSALFE